MCPVLPKTLARRQEKTWVACPKPAGEGCVLSALVLVVMRHLGQTNSGSEFPNSFCHCHDAVWGCRTLWGVRRGQKRTRDQAEGPGSTELLQLARAGVQLLQGEDSQNTKVSLHGMAGTKSCVSTPLPSTFGVSLVPGGGTSIPAHVPASQLHGSAESIGKGDPQTLKLK